MRQLELVENELVLLVASQTFARPSFSFHPYRAYLPHPSDPKSIHTV